MPGPGATVQPFSGSDPVALFGHAASHSSLIFVVQVALSSLNCSDGVCAQYSVGQRLRVSTNGQAPRQRIALTVWELLEPDRGHRLRRAEVVADPLIRVLVAHRSPHVGQGAHATVPLRAVRDAVKGFATIAGGLDGLARVVGEILARGRGQQLQLAHVPVG